MSNISKGHISIQYFLMTFAFISLGTETISVYLHGLIGFIIIVFISALLASTYNTRYRIILFRKNLEINKWLWIFNIWYLLGIVGSAFLWGNGISDWKFMSTPFVFMIAFYYATTYLSINRLYKFFINSFIIILGFQAIFSYIIMKTEIGIARETIMQDQNGIVFGGPGGFALKAILLPIFVWHASQEKRINRIILYFFIVSIILSILSSTYATATLLLIFAVLFFIFYSTIFIINKKSRFLAIIYSILFIGITYVTYNFTKENPLFNAFYTRVNNIVEDPTGGGYEGADRKQSRWDKALISINSFKNNPVFGNKGGNIRYNKNLGGHSSFFDSLAAYGILGGGGALIALVFLFYRNSLKTYLNYRNFRTLAVLVSVTIFLLGGIVNPFWEGYQPTFILLVAYPFVLSSYQKVNMSTVSV